MTTAGSVPRAPMKYVDPTAAHWYGGRVAEAVAVAGGVALRETGVELGGGVPPAEPEGEDVSDAEGETDASLPVTEGVADDDGVMEGVADDDGVMEGVTLDVSDAVDEGVARRGVYA